MCHPIHACAPVSCVLIVFSSPFSFSTSSHCSTSSPFLMSTSAAQREVHVKPPAQLQLGERGHFRLRHTPHIIARLPGCNGQAADAVSAYTQVKMEDAHKLLKIPKSECPDIWIRLPRHKWPKSWSSMEDPVVPLERNLYGHPLAGLLWERQFEKVLLKHGWEKNSKIGNVSLFIVKKDYSYLCMWTT